MTRMYFDVWASDDLNGTALGELTQAYDREIRVVDQAIGSGQFTINRHDAQWTDGWCAQDNLVRVRLVAGGPFAYDDSRYVHAFFIESGKDVVLSKDEEVGEEMTRGGRDAVVILRRAILNYEADFAGDAGYAAKALLDGQWHFSNRNAGEVLRIVLRNAAARSPNPLAPSTHDFNIVHDSSGADWSDTDADWLLPIGKDYLEILSILAAGDVYWRMGPDLDLHAWDADPGSDVSATVSFVKGVNIREAAERQVQAREAISRALVQGTLKDGKLKYRWVPSAPTETFLGGRREGFVEYQSTPTNSRLDKAGAKAIRTRRQQFEGPTTLGVIDAEGAEAFVDYVPGDTVTIDVPGVFDDVASRVYAIILEETENGECDVSIELEQAPFDPLSNPTGGGSSGGGSGGKCGDCPPLPPYIPTPVPGSGTTTTGGVVWYPHSQAGIYALGYEGTGDSPPAGFTYRPLDATNFAYLPGSGDPHDMFRGFTVLASSATVDLHAKATCSLVAGVGATATLHILRNGASVGSATAAYGGTGLGFWSPSLEAFATGVALAAGDTLTTDWVMGDGGFVTVPAGTGGTDLGFEIVTAGVVIPDIVPPPLEGQVHGEQFTGDGSTTGFQTAYPYAPGSLHVHVGGVLVNAMETNPGTGTFTLPITVPTGTVIHVDYQNAGTTPTGGGGVTPSGDWSVIPPELVGAITASFVPTYIPSGEMFTVPADRQALFAMTIDVAGTLDVSGYLIEVD